MFEDFILKEKLNIYNNIAQSGDSVGRLSVYYDIYPSPAIFWEFETKSKDGALPKYLGTGKFTSPFIGNSLSIPNSFLYPNEQSEPLFSLRKNLTGSTTKVFVGDQTILGKDFEFFLPNAKFQKVGRVRNCLSKEVSYKVQSGLLNLGSSMREGFAEVEIENGILLRLHTPIEAIDWLQKQRSVGTYLTTRGELVLENDLGINDAVKLIDDVSHLLSFANGGFIAPLTVKMRQRDFKQEFPAVFTAFVVDPVERIAGTWFDSQSDVGDLLKCFPTFQRMLDSEQWKGNYWLILMWYFQAIQPLGIQLDGKPWPVAANALGAALEKLASIILVDEKGLISSEVFYGDGKKWGMSLENRIRELLKIVGIEEIPVYANNDAIWWFKEMRNDATHPKSNYEWAQEKVNVILGNAIQWIEEVLLWRLGYVGGYSDRSRDGKYIEKPRYDLSTRNSSW